MANLTVHFAPAEASAIAFNRAPAEGGAKSEYLGRKEHGHEVGEENSRLHDLQAQ